MTLLTDKVFASRREDNQFRKVASTSRKELFPSHSLNKVFEEYRCEAKQYIQAVTFLVDYPHLIGVLLEARQHIRSVFGEAEVYMSVDIDPDDDEFKEMFCEIKTVEEPKAAVKSLREFDKRWFAEAVTRTDNKLNFTV